MRKVERDNTALGHIVGYSNAERIPNVPFFEVYRLVALELVIGDGLRIYVLQLLILAECNTARIAIGGELLSNVSQLLIIAECITPQIAIGEELRKYVPQLQITSISIY